jgi:3-oxo-5alpha-steroid 4-dehydrogenase
LRSRVRQGKRWAVWLNGILALHMGLKRGDSLADLARACGLPEGNLEATVAEYAEIVEGKRKDPWGKRQTLLRRLGAGPYYAVNVCSNNRFSPVVAISLGGLVVSEQTGAVIGPGGSEIKGLYAVGRDAIGVSSNKYVSGLSLADCVYSGRRSGAVLS